jgi:hypothetical protein
MDRIGGPSHVREGLLDALAQGVGVTAKISWLTQPANRSHSPSNSPSNSESEGSNSVKQPEILEGKPRWIHCTPLMGSDSKPGVIMIVMVDKEEITGQLNPSSPAMARMAMRSASKSEVTGRDLWPLQGVGVGASSAKFTSAKLYADYLKREGRTAQAAQEASVDGRKSMTSERTAKSREDWVRGGQPRSMADGNKSIGAPSYAPSTSTSTARGRTRDG